ncbi:RHS repeat-associated core domain-containing protein, partial [Chromobacterium vaccinii]
PDGQRTDYHYDPLGRRIAKISQGQATLYGWDGDVLAFETRDEEAVHYLFEPDSFVPLAQVHTDAIRGVKVPAWSQHNPYDPDKDPLRQAGPEPKAPKAVYYYHTDHLGTPQALTDEQGALALVMDYQAWGQAREVIADAASKAGIRNPFRFQGQYHDDESGLHYNRHRYYDPEIGRFISRDPIGLMGGINIHSYAPNPLEWVDPLGLAKKKAKPSAPTAEKECKQCPNECKNTTRMRHYTSISRANSIMESGQILPGEHNRVYMEPANKKPLSVNDVAKKYRIPRERANAYVETDVCEDDIEWKSNPLYGTKEATVKGAVKLRNPTMSKR